MVPHETIEAKIVEAFGFPIEEERVVTVVGIPDQSKGESLVLLTTRELSPKEIRKRLLAAGLPSLWIPKVVKIVGQIPLLGTGKLDLGAGFGSGSGPDKISTRAPIPTVLYSRATSAERIRIHP
jgi:hypothetical protein